MPGPLHHLLPSLSSLSPTEHLAAGVTQQRTAHCHFAPAWEIPAPRRKALIPGELCRGRAGAGGQLGAAEPQPGWNCLTADAPSSGASSAFPARRRCHRLHRGAAVWEKPCPFPQGHRSSSSWMHTPDEFSQSVVTEFLILKSLVPYAESRRQAKLSYLPSPTYIST